MSPLIPEGPPRANRPEWTRFFGSIPVLFLLCVSFSYVAVAAVVSMQPPRNAAGDVEIPVVLYGDGDDMLSGVQFDLQYDPQQYALVGVHAGAAAADAGKEVILSEPASGSGRVLVTGFNNNTLYDGHVATIVLRRLQNGTPGDGFAMGNVLASDPLGNGVAIDFENLFEFPPAPPDKIENELDPQSVADDEDRDPVEGDGPDNDAPITPDGSTTDQGDESDDAGAIAGGVSALADRNAETSAPGASGARPQLLPGQPVVARRPAQSAANPSQVRIRPEAYRSGIRPGTPTAARPAVQPGNSRLRSAQDNNTITGQNPMVGPEGDQPPAGDNWRLAMVTPAGGSFGAPETDIVADGPPFGAGYRPFFWGYPGVIAWVLGTGLFGSILALRTIALDRMRRPRERKL